MNRVLARLRHQKIDLADSTVQKKRAQKKNPITTRSAKGLRQLRAGLSNLTEQETGRSRQSQGRGKAQKADRGQAETKDVGGQKSEGKKRQHENTAISNAEEPEGSCADGGKASTETKQVVRLDFSLWKRHGWENGEAAASRPPIWEGECQKARAFESCAARNLDVDHLPPLEETVLPTHTRALARRSERWKLRFLVPLEHVSSS